MATDVFKDPFKQDAFSDPFQKGVFNDPFGTANNKSKALDTTEELQKLASQAGYEQKEKETEGVLSKVGRVLNWDIANISGIALGALRDDMDIMEGRKYGVANNTGFADVYKEMFGEPETAAGRLAIGTSGFISDVFFSPLTYLTLGYAGYVKAGSKVTKGASKLFNAAQKQVIGHADALVAEGMASASAKKVAMWTAKNDLNTVFQKILSESKTLKSGDKLSQELFDKMLDAGLQSDTAEKLMNLGGNLIDRGGIKMFGKSIVTSEQLAKTPLGKAARAIGEIETVKVLGDTLGKLFIFDFKKHPKVAEIASRTATMTRRAYKSIVEEFDEMFKDLPDADTVEFFEKGIAKREEEYLIEAKTRNEAIERYITEFPDDTPIRSRAEALEMYNKIDDIAVNEISKIRKMVDSVVDPFFKQRANDVKSGNIVVDIADDIQSTPAMKGFAKVDKLTSELKDLQAKIRELPKKRGETSTLEKVDDLLDPITREEAIIARNKLIGYQEEKIQEQIMKALDVLGRASQGESVGKQGISRQTIKSLSPEEAIVQSERMIKKIQDDLSKKDRLLADIIDSRKKARQISKEMKIEFKDNPRLQSIADKLWNNADSITAKLAKIAGVPEDEAYKFYIRPYYKDFVTVKKSAIGRSASPFGKVKDDFTKIWTPEGYKNRTDLIKNPAESFKRAKLDVVSARIKSDGIKSIFKSFAKQAEGRSASEMEALGFVKYEKKILNEKLSGWIPKEIKEEVINFAEPKSSGISELARVTGFDWATNMMKSWATSLFPAFHVMNVTSNQFQLMVKLGMDWLNPQTSWNTFTMAGYTAFPADGLIRKTLGMTKEAEKEFMEKKFFTNSGVAWTNKKLMQEIKKHSDLLDQGTYGDLEQGLTEVGRHTNWNPASLHFAALHHGREFGNFGEVQAKISAIQTGIINGKTMKQSIKDAEDAIFNYGKLTTFEREYLKRLIPFYTFARKNFEFQLKSLTTEPGKVATQFKLFNNISDSYGGSMTPEEESGLPKFVLDKIGIKAGVNSFGQRQYMTGFGLPIEEFLGRFSGEKGFIWDTFSNVIAQSNPLVKYPFERATGIDLFRGRELVEIDNAEVFRGLIDSLGGLEGGVGKEFADLINYREVPEQAIRVNGEIVGYQTKVIADPLWLHFFRNLPTARLQNTLSAQNQEPGSEHLMRALLGGQMYTIDVAREEFFRDLEQKKELSRWLDRAGIINTKEIYYTPKERNPN